MQTALTAVPDTRVSPIRQTMGFVVVKGALLFTAFRS